MGTKNSESVAPKIDEPKVPETILTDWTWQACAVDAGRKDAYWVAKDADTPQSVTKMEIHTLFCEPVAEETTWRLLIFTMPEQGEFREGPTRVVELGQNISIEDAILEAIKTGAVENGGAIGEHEVIINYEGTVSVNVAAHSEVEAVSLVQHMANNGDERLFDAKDYGMDFLPASASVYK